MQLKCHAPRYLYQVLERRRSRMLVKIVPQALSAKCAQSLTFERRDVTFSSRVVRQLLQRWYFYSSVLIAESNLNQ